MSASTSHLGDGKDVPKPSKGSLPTLWSLIGRLKDSADQEGWAEFADIHGRLIRAVALHAGLNAIEAQEVVQDTLLSVARKMPEFKCDPKAGSFKSWLLSPRPYFTGVLTSI